MFTTTIAAAAFSVLLPAGNEKVTPAWQSDYRTAITTAAAQQKPVAVFIGRGDAGYNKLVSDGKITDDSGRLLVDGYVCVYVNTDTPEGKALAGQFNMNDGLVISTPGGKAQALRHAGTVSPADLNTYLVKYSQPNAVTTTEFRGTAATGVVPAGYYPGGTVIYGGCPNGQCGAAPVYGYSTCPNGKCPTAR